MKLASFYFDHDGLFVIPVEHLGSEGMTETFASALHERGVGEDWIALFDQAFARYWRRASELYERAPETWFPPRRQHVGIVTDESRVRPYSQPLKQSSWLLYESDFDPATSGTELATYLFFHTERYGLSGNILAAAVHNLAYFLVRSPDERDAFAEQVSRCRRPDADSFVALAEALPWIQRLYHEKLAAPSLVLTEPLGKLEAADLLVPASLQGEVKALATRFKADAQNVVKRYYAAHQPQPGGKEPGGKEPGGKEPGLKEPSQTVLEWLKREQPRVLVATEGGRILWDPEAPEDVASLGEIIDGIASAPAESLRRDLEVIADRTTRFLDALSDPEALPNPHELEQEAGTYIHEARKLIAYDVRHPAMNRLREPSPPFERWMLGARTLHEWGHLAVDAGMVRVPDERAADFAEAQGRARELLDRLVAEAPAALQQVARKEAELLGGRGSPSEALFSALMGRMDDFQSNVLARRFLAPEEMETYARANVITLAQEAAVGPWLKLVRHAYEYQYLRLGGLAEPFVYFAESIWFQQHFVDAGVVSEQGARSLFEAVSRVCDLYAVDERFFGDEAAGTVAGRVP